MLGFGMPNVVAAVSDRPVDVNPPMSDADAYVVGFHEMPEDRDTYQGEPVTFVDGTLQYFVVEPENPTTFQLKVKTDDRVRYLEENHRDYELEYTPDDPRYDDQYGPQQTNTESAWDTALGSTAVTVGVLDSGINTDHEDFDASLVSGYDYYNDDSTYDDESGCGYHGSHVAGTAAARTDNGAGIAGMSNSEIRMHKIFDGGACNGATTSEIAQALKDMGNEGVHISSNSWSGGSSTTLNEAIDHANDKGVIHVAAAGNDGSCTDCVSEPWASRPDKVAIVSCTDSNDDFCSFSSQGPKVDLAAPGNSVLSVDGGTTTGYTNKDGTSMSTPHVSGAVALYIDANGDVSHSTIETELADSADDVGLSENEQGAGRLNAGALMGSGSGNTPPTADFTSSCDDLTCDFDASSSTDPDGNITSFDWDFGDGNIGTGETTSHTYDSEGTYTVTLTVTDDDGAQDNETKNVTVQSGSTLFSDGFEDGNLDDWVLSEDSSNLWRAGDDCESTASGDWQMTFSRASPDCDYDAGTVVGSATTPTLDADGASELTLTFSHFFEVEDYSTSAYDVMTVEVSDDGGSSWSQVDQWDSTDPTNGAHTSKTYDLTDHASTDTEIRFTFDSQDDVSNDNPGWYVDDIEVTAEGVDDSNNTAPTADFTSSCDDLTCDFDASSSTDPDGNITSFDWDFGDGNIGTGETTSHTYDSEGTYTVTLTVTDDDGAQDTQQHNVTVSANDPPTATFTSDCTDLNCTFDASNSTDSDGTINSFDWEFGDGTTGSGEVVNHAYDAPGTYTVNLTVTDDDGAEDTESQNVTVDSTDGEEKLYAEDFDDGEAQDWHQSGASNDLWRVSSDCQTPDTGSHQLAFSRASPDCDYDVGTAEGWARSPVVDAGSTSTLTLEFAHFFEVEDYDGSAYDVMELQVSDDAGDTWTTLDSWDSTDHTNGEYTAKSYDVSDYATSDFRVRFTFDSIDSSYNDNPGWHVDTFEVIAG